LIIIAISKTKARALLFSFLPRSPKGGKTDKTRKGQNGHHGK
jgi:hypothetical protein